MNKANLNLFWSYSIIETLIKCECYNFYIAPGLRNTPLIKAIISNKRAKYFTNIDERALSYRAIGSSKSTGQASTLICTSGTALANFLPAVIEAHESGIPLIIISADRPKEAIWNHENQSINQVNLYSNYVSDCISLEAPNSQTEISSIINQIFYKTKQSIQNLLPLHINIPFREPLINPSFDFDFASVKPTNIHFDSPKLPSTNLNHNLRELIHATDNILLVFGQLDHFSSLEVTQLIQVNLPKYFDITSNFKFSKNSTSISQQSSYIKDELTLLNNIVPSFDHHQVYQYFEKHPPELIIHFGGNITSKSYANFLKNKNIPSINIDKQFRNIYNHCSNSHYQNIPPSLWDKCFYPLLEEKKLIINFDQIIKKKIDAIENNDFTIPWISKNIIEFFKSKSTFYVGNSTIIRSFDLYCNLNTTYKSHHVYYNRGVSGIEGFIACGVGLSEQIFPKPVYLVLGDISFIHDLNSLSLLNNQTNLKIIILNNHCGGIFSLLPIQQDKEVLDVISTSHNLNFKYICKNFSISYQQISTKKEFFHKMSNEFESQQEINATTESTTSLKNTVYELVVNNETNKQIYNELKSIK